MDTVIKFGEGNVSGVNMPLIPFNCIFDTDFGLVYLIYKEYLDPNIFDIEWFKQNHTIREIVFQLYNREEENPLLLFMKDKENKELADSLYKDFMSKEYNKILDKSMKTEMFSLFTAYKTFGQEIKPCVVYKQDIELDAINDDNVVKNFTKVKLYDIKDNIKIYEQFFFKSINDAYITLTSSQIKSKTIYLAGYKFNIDTINDNVLILMANRNKVRNIDLYNKEKLIGGND